VKKNDDKRTKGETELESKVTQLSDQVADLDNKLRTALADYQNIRKELEKQQELRESMLKKHVFNDLIDIFSDLFFAMEQLPTELKNDTHIHGLTHIIAKYKDLLRNHGVTEISFAEGDAYDAKYAEVLGVVSHAEFDNKIAQMIQPGYRIGEVLIKPARVMIYKKTESKS
jgi:molecular chaperone GrpE